MLITSTNDYDDIMYKRVMALQSEVKHLKENVLGNINQRLIDNEMIIKSIEIRTSIFVPKRDNES